jgi:ubiquinone/menaquinone biosynthesis C-methylase UbiE
LSLPSIFSYSPTWFLGILNLFFFALGYHFPNDATEIERLEFQHIMIHHAIGEKLYYAPLPPKPRHILDIGTGTGTWAMEMGDLFPDTVIEATDLSPIQPTAVSDNVHFLIDDAEQADWGVSPDYYDYIHMRVMLGCFKSMKSVIKQAYKHIVPGGYLESQELMHMPFCDDGTMKPDWPFLEWSILMDEVSTTAERPLDVARHLKDWYEDAGFVDVQERVFWGPIGTWPKDHDLKALGRWWQENLLMGLQGFSLGYFSRVLRWTAEEVEVCSCSISSFSLILFSALVWNPYLDGSLDIPNTQGWIYALPVSLTPFIIALPVPSIIQSSLLVNHPSLPIYFSNPPISQSSPNSHLPGLPRQRPPIPQRPLRARLPQSSRRHGPQTLSTRAQTERPW